MRTLDRRTFLRGAGGISVALPFLDIMTSRAADPSLPRRLVLLFSPNSPNPNTWCSGSETGFTLGGGLQALQGHRDDLLLLAGVDMESSHHGPGDQAHQRCMPHLLTGTEMVPTGGGNLSENGGGISVDQHIARTLGAGTKFDSLGFGVGAISGASGGPFSTISFTGPAEPVPVEDDPQGMFDRVFGDVVGDSAELDVLRAKRHSVLDAVLEDAHRVRGKLGSKDAQSLENHLDALREIEQSIDTVTTLGGACAVPDPSVSLPAGMYESESFPALSDVQTRLLAMTLACDLTRVSTLQYRHALAGDLTFTWLGQNEDFHNISHKGNGDQTGQQQMTEITDWFALQLSNFLDLLKAMPEGDGTVFDNTMVVWFTELGRANGHTRRDMRWLLAGGGCGYFDTGRYLQMGGAWHNDLLVSLCNYMGLPDQTFGNPAYCNGPMPGLV